MEKKQSYNQSKILWRCHRGMLELDLLLLPFVKDRFDTLTDTQKDDFLSLLEIEDPSLYAWLLGHEKPEDEGLKAMIALINEHAGSKISD